MAAGLDEIRKAAERVAASHGLDVVDIEFAGPRRNALCGFASRRTPRAGRN